MPGFHFSRFSEGLLFAGLGLLGIAPLGAAQPLQQVLFDFENPNPAWTSNVWGGPGTVAITPSPHPKFGARALHSTLKAVARGGNTISPWLAADAPWRGGDWNAVSLWFKGDGSPTQAVLRVQTGQGTQVEQDYSCDLPMNSTAWRRFILPAASFWNRHRVPMDPHLIVRCYIGHTGDHSFEVDQIALEAAQRPVPWCAGAPNGNLAVAPELFQFRDGRYAVRFDPAPLLPGPATAWADFRFPGANQQAEVSLPAENPAGEVFLVAAEPAPMAGPSTLTLEITREGQSTSASWSFETVLDRPLPDPTPLSLLPAPKECRLGPGSFPLAAGITVERAGAASELPARMLAEELGTSCPGLSVREIQAPDESPLCIRLGTGCEASVEARKRLPQLPAGGYLLDAGSQGVTVRAREGEGLRNGVLTLLQAIESQWALTGTQAIPELHVLDWPSLPLRAVSLPLPNGRWGHPNDPPADPDSFLRFLHETVVRTKLNLVVLIVEQAMRYDSHPKVSGPAAWTKEDVKRVFDTLRGWGVEPVPCMNSLGHMNWLCIPRRDLAEDGDVHQICTLHPDSTPVVKALYQEIIDLVHPKYFHAGLDEIRWKTETLPSEQRCPRCAGKSKQDLFVDWVNLLHGFFAGQNVRMLMWGDMILPGHNGGPPYQLAETVGRLPKDVIMANWSTRLSPDSTSWLREQGFSQVIKSNSAGATLAEIPLLTGNMFGCWSKVPWLTEGTEPELERNAYGAFLEAAEYSWNHWPDLFDPMPPLEEDFFARRPLVQMRIGASPLGECKLEPVALPQALILDGVPRGTVRFGHVSFDAAGAVVPEPGREAVIPVGSRADAVYLLHGVRLLDRAAMTGALKRREHWQGVPVAHYEVRYESGATEAIPVRYPMEVRDPEPGWCAAPLAYGALGVYPSTAKSDGMHLYPLQWRNPRPEDRIETIAIRAVDGPAQVALAGMAVSVPAGHWDSPKK